MKIGIIGTGSVGKHLAKGFAELGHDIVIGTRNPEKLSDWLKETGNKISATSNSEAAKASELIIIATSWAGTMHAIELAGKENFNGKIVIDVTNPLKFTAQGLPPEPAIGYPDSGGKQIQEFLPGAKVVKCFNIVTAAYMVNPLLQEGAPDMFLAGNDIDARVKVAEIARAFGWQVHDLGGIEQSYLLEALAMIWIRYGFLNNHWTHAFKLLKK